jgi:hypothetical protein
VVIFVKSFSFRFKYDMFTNIFKFLAEFILGLNLVMNTHNTPFIYAVSFIHNYTDISPAFLYMLRALQTIKENKIG